MTSTGEKRLLDAIRNAAIPLEDPHGYDALMELIGDARFVLLGGETHGTHEFCAARAEITMRLVREKGFAAVAIGADWPDVYRVNRYVRGIGVERHAIDSLVDLGRFPSWMWRNADMLDFIGDLREYNTLLPNESRTGFYGLDLYSLYTSIAAVIDYLQNTDPDAAQRIRERYSRFEQVGQPGNGTGMSLDIDRSRRDAAVVLLRELQRERFERIGREGFAIRGEAFHARHSDRIVQDADSYYRGFFSGRASCWNLRSRHMADTLTALDEHFGVAGLSKIVVWEHNSHAGNAHASEMAARKQISLGQLVRERYGDEAVLVGLTTYSGTVSAASGWGEPVERKAIRHAIPESYEGLFHRTGLPAFLLPLRNLHASLGGLRERRPERAIGAVYVPDSEQERHYFNASLPEQFDAAIHIDQTTAVEPIDYTPVWEAEEVPESYPIRS